MKVLAIMGGPRKGYGTICMEKLEYELKSLQDVDFEYLYLKDVNLQSCRGCSLCFFKGEDKCPLKNDDRDEIINKINEADGVIFMAPTYSLHVPALMKNFFDRLAYIFHRPCFFGKIAIGDSIDNVVDLYGQPFQIFSIGRELYEYEYLERWFIGKESIVQKKYYFLVHDKKILNKRIRTTIPPSYDSLYYYQSIPEY